MPSSTLPLVVALACGVAGGAIVTSETRVRCTTTTGDFVVQMTPDRAPLGAQHFVDLVEDGYYTDIPLFRAVSGFIVQFGIPGRLQDKAKNDKWTRHQIKDDPHPQPEGRSKFARGDISFAGAGANSRTTQAFVALTDRTGLGGVAHETPFGRVVEGMEATIDAWYTGYGDTAPWGDKGPDQGKIWAMGNAYLEKEFPKMDYIRSCQVVGVEVAGGQQGYAPDDEVRLEAVSRRHAHHAAGSTDGASVVPLVAIGGGMLLVCLAGVLRAGGTDKKNK